MTKKNILNDVKAIIAQDSDFLKPLLTELIQEIPEAEMDQALGAGSYERADQRKGYRAGHYSRQYITRVGSLELRIPRDREGRFSTEIFEGYQRSERALLQALSEMYVQGVSTRKVKAITEELCGHEFSTSTISNINKTLDEQLTAFWSRHWGPLYHYIRPIYRNNVALPINRNSG